MSSHYVRRLVAKWILSISLAISLITVVGCSSYIGTTITDDILRAPDLKNKIIGFAGNQKSFVIKHDPTTLKLGETTQTVTVEHQWVAVNKQTRIIGKDGSQISFDKLRHGETVEIWLTDKESKENFPIAQQIRMIETRGAVTEPMPADFNIILQYGVGGKNELNTFEQTFTKDLIQKGTKTVPFNLTVDDLEEVFVRIKQTDVSIYPEKFHPETAYYIEPHETFYLKIQMNGKSQEIQWVAEDAGRSPETEELHDLLKYIINVIENKREYKKLPKPVGWYL